MDGVPTACGTPAQPLPWHSPTLLPTAASTGYSVAVRVAGGHVYRIPTARVHLDWGMDVRDVEVGIMKDLPTEVLLGNDLGLLTSTFEDTHPGGVCPVTTCHQARKALHTDSEGTVVSETSPTLGPDNTPSLTWDSPTDFAQATREDVTLAPYRQQAGREPGGVGEVRFAWDQGKLYRTSGGVDQVPHRQLVVPGKYRRDLLKIGHDIPLAGHLGHRRTLHRLTQSFFWPGLSGDVRDYCRTCEVCQRVGKRGDTRKATLRPLPIVGEPFRRVAVDLIGPLVVPSTTGKKYILTVVDYATRYPEAVALRDIHAETVAGALLQIFSRVGFPQEILSDQGTQFMAEVTQQLWRLCGIKPLYSSPYHPQTNGLCKRFNGTLKQLLRTFTMSHKDWESHLPHLLFAYREVPQEATGFSSFELLYGRRVRGPLDLLQEHWEGALAEEGTSAIDYVLEFRDRLQELTALVRDNLQAAQTKQKRWYDRSARDRTFQLGQKVLVLRPVKQNKLQAAWEGPYKIIEKICDTTFIAARCSDERIQRTFHVNMLKPFHEREAVAAICALDAGDLEDLPLPVLPGDPSAQGIADVRLGEGLSPRHREQAQQVLQEHQDLFPSRLHLCSSASGRYPESNPLAADGVPNPRCSERRDAEGDPRDAGSRGNRTI
uniref:Gypsy retrotransposon integrase-like protein 1 n=1 Tax=Leptobrachium leishanense TaxID=445787 RepID=A0A8C5PDU0_9ANUR